MEVVLRVRRSGAVDSGIAADATPNARETTATEWLDQLEAAWKAERNAQRARIAMERSGRTLVERVALGIALGNLRIVDEQSAPGDRVRVRVSVPEQVDLDNLRLAPGDPIRLWAEHPEEEAAVRGVFERRDDQSVWLMLDRPVDELDRDYALDPEAPEVTFDRGDARSSARGRRWRPATRPDPRRRRARQATAPVRADHVGAARCAARCQAARWRSTVRCAPAISR